MKHIGMPNRGWLGSLLIIVLPTSIIAQPIRISGRINTSQWTALRGNVHPNARSEYDRGKADASLQLNSVTLVLRPSDSQQAALERLLNDQQDPASGNYRHWLAPEEYADRFGVTQSDIDKITGWAQSQGLKVTGVARARNAVTLMGSAAQVGSAFHTEIHLYQVDGETHYANATEPSVPAAMRDVVAAVHGLHDFRLRSKARKLIALGPASDGFSPAYTSSTTGNHYLAPDDFATIFNVNPIYSAGINGSSQKIVIVGQSEIVPSHLSTFTAYFGTPAVNLTTILVPNTQDPGISESDEQESDLDLQWSSAVARGASLIFVYSYDVTDAVRYAIDQNLAPVISMSYGECEESATRTDGATMRGWAQQANAQGITWVTASGDSGAANCYQASSGPLGSANADLTVSVDLPASIPEVTGIGGTTFSEGSGTYWNTTNSTTRASALSYIPEVAWNDSVADGSPSASGGGASQFFSKPSWQTGAGVPNDGARDVPDLAFPASPDHDGYIVYTTSGRQTTWYVFGGTSCGTPAFSGVLSLLNQYLVSGGSQPASDATEASLEKGQGALDGSIDKWIEIIQYVAQCPIEGSAFIVSLQSFLNASNAGAQEEEKSFCIDLGPLSRAWSRACDVPPNVRPEKVTVRETFQALNSFRNRFAHVPFPYDQLQEIWRELEICTFALFEIRSSAANEESPLSGSFALKDSLLRGSGYRNTPDNWEAVERETFVWGSKNIGQETWDARPFVFLDKMMRPYLLSRLKNEAGSWEYIRFLAEANAVYGTSNPDLLRLLPRPTETDYAIDKEEPDTQTFQAVANGVGGSAAFMAAEPFNREKAFAAVRERNFEPAIVFWKSEVERRPSYHSGWQRLGFAQREFGVDLMDSNPLGGENLLRDSVNSFSRAVSHSDPQYGAEAYYNRSKAHWRLWRHTQDQHEYHSAVEDAQTAAGRFYDERFISWSEFLKENTP